MENKQNNDYELNYIRGSVSDFPEEVHLLEKKVDSLFFLITSLKRLLAFIAVSVTFFAILICALHFVNRSYARREPLKAIMLVGGEGPDEDVSVSVELFTGDKFSCVLDTNLPDKRIHHSVTKLSGYPLVCGGSWSTTGKSCLLLNEDGQWEKNITLSKGREGHAAWEHKGDTYLLGGLYEAGASAVRVTNNFLEFHLKNRTQYQ